MLIDEKNYLRLIFSGRVETVFAKTCQIFRACQKLMSQGEVRRLFGKAVNLEMKPEGTTREVEQSKYRYGLTVKCIFNMAVQQTEFR